MTQCLVNMNIDMTVKYRRSVTLLDALRAGSRGGEQCRCNARLVLVEQSEPENE
jgi:hypothetical protein